MIVFCSLYRAVECALCSLALGRSVLRVCPFVLPSVCAPAPSLPRPCPPAQAPAGRRRPAKCPAPQIQCPAPLSTSPAPSVHLILGSSIAACRLQQPVGSSLTSAVCTPTAPPPLSPHDSALTPCYGSRTLCAPQSALAWIVMLCALLGNSGSPGSPTGEPWLPGLTNLVPRRTRQRRHTRKQRSQLRCTHRHIGTAPGDGPPEWLQRRFSGLVRVSSGPSRCGA